MYIWNEDQLITLLVVALLKISTEEKKYGYGPLNISGLASLIISVFYIHLIKLYGVSTGQNLFSVLSFLVCLAGIYVFGKDDDQKNTNIKNTLLIITLNASFINGYYNIKSLYILLPLSVAAYSLQIFCEWFIPKTNAFRSIKNGVNVLLFSSFTVFAITVAWIAVERLK